METEEQESQPDPDKETAFPAVPAHIETFQPTQHVAAQNTEEVSLETSLSLQSNVVPPDSPKEENIVDTQQEDTIPAKQTQILSETPQREIAKPTEPPPVQLAQSHDEKRNTTVHQVIHTTVPKENLAQTQKTNTAKKKSIETSELFPERDADSPFPLADIQVVKDMKGRIVFGLSETTHEVNTNGANPEMEGASPPVPITSRIQLERMLDVIDFLSLNFENNQKLKQQSTYENLEHEKTEDNALFSAPFAKTPLSSFDALVQKFASLSFPDQEKKPSEFVLIVSTDIMRYVEETKEKVSPSHNTAEKHVPKHCITIATGNKELVIEVQELRKILKLQTLRRRNATTPNILLYEHDTALEELGVSLINYQWWDEDRALVLVLLVFLNYLTQPLKQFPVQATVFSSPTISSGQSIPAQQIYFTTSL